MCTQLRRMRRDTVLRKNVLWKRQLRHWLGALENGSGQTTSTQRIHMSKMRSGKQDVHYQLKSLHDLSLLFLTLPRNRDRALPDTPGYSKLVLDGTTGQNAISQVSVFTEAVGCDGLIITKLDGTAKGGVLIALAEELGVAVDYVGLGEGIDDIQQFDAKQFAEALFAS